MTRCARLYCFITITLHPENPRQWIEVDKKVHGQTPHYSAVPPKYKSCLVGCGNFQTTEFHLLLTWTCTTLCTADMHWSVYPHSFK